MTSVQELFEFAKRKPKISAVILGSFIFVLVILIVVLIPVTQNGDPTKTPRHEMVRSAVRMNPESTANRESEYKEKQDEAVRGYTEENPPVQEYLSKGGASSTKNFVVGMLQESWSTTRASLRIFISETPRAALDMFRSMDASEKFTAFAGFSLVILIVASAFFIV